jgi:DNA polymerase-3 subunit epsilon
MNIKNMLNDINLGFDIDQPIIFFDCETTGLDLEQDDIIELSAIKLNPNKEHEIMNIRFNTKKQLSDKVIEMTKLTNDILKNEPFFQEKADEIFNFFDRCDLAGYNIKNFDIPILMSNLNRCGYHFDPMKNKSRMLDVFKILSKREPRNLSSAYTFYTNKIMDKEHDANFDNLATIEIFKEQALRYYKNQDVLLNGDDDTKKDNDGNTVIDFSGLFLKTPKGEFIYGKGKHKDEVINGNNIDYIKWVVDKSTFNNNTKFVAKELYDWWLRKEEKKNKK